MKINELINAMQAPETTKTAAAAPQAAPVASPEPQNQDVLGNLEKVAAGALPQTVVPPKVDAVDVLMQQAVKLANADEAANLALMQKMGAAFADSFIAKMAAYEQTLAASAQPLQPAVLQTYVGEEQKLAQDLSQMDPAELQHQAAQAGYQDALNKVAGEYQSGHDAALQEVANLGVSEFYKGAAETEEIVRLYAENAAG